jgi:hypothetical protein
MPGNAEQIKPFDNFAVLDGYHCWSSSYAKVYHYFNCPLSEEMLLGLGSGMGLIYWHQKGTIPFMGGRDHFKDFHEYIGKRTGVAIQKKTTTSTARAEKTMIEMLNRHEPVMMCVDMGYLPCFDFGEGYHFGGHTHVVCGYDGCDTVLISEIEPRETGLKKGFTYELSLEQLARARGSQYKPFPPKNTYFEFDFAQFRPPTADDIHAAIAQTLDRMLNPPIRNIGVKGIRKAAQEITRWPQKLTEEELRFSILNLYIFVTIGGTGGGIFRYMYSRFLDEASGIIANPELKKVSAELSRCGDLWTETAAPCVDALEVENPEELIKDVPDKLAVIASEEEEVFEHLKRAIS